MDGFGLVAAAVAVILSAIVRMIRTDAAWKAVDDGYAGFDHVRELTGILDKRALQDVIGPPTMEGVYHAARPRIESARRLTGFLMGDLKLDAASLALAVLALFSDPFGFVGEIAGILFLGAFAYQLAGWGATSLLLRRG